ncbi:hypothetical protein ABTL65_19650, partial [Acinetobacter baumannii]
PIRKAVDKAFLSGQADLSEALGPDFDVVRKDSTVVVIDMKSDPFQKVRLKKLLRSKADTSRVLQSGNLPSRDRELILNQLGKV